MVIAIAFLLASAGVCAYEIVGADTDTLNRMANDPNWFDGAVGFSRKDIKGFRAEAKAELKRRQETAAPKAWGTPPAPTAAPASAPAPQAVQQEQQAPQGQQAAEPPKNVAPTSSTK
ncbi:MAG: hypothetical protein WC091_18925 [Sulfuricellaceae bacterium]